MANFTNTNSSNNWFSSVMPVILSPCYPFVVIVVANGVDSRGARTSWCTILVGGKREQVSCYKVQQQHSLDLFLHFMPITPANDPR